MSEVGSSNLVNPREGEPPSRPELGGIALGLWAMGLSRRLGAELAAESVPALLLAGPEMEVRLHGASAAQRAGDLEILVPRRFEGHVRDLMLRNDWEKPLHPGAIARSRVQETFERGGFRVHLRWRLSSGNLPRRAATSLVRAIWVGAQSGHGSLLEPAPEPLLVLLATGLIQGRSSAPGLRGDVDACARLVRDWGRVWNIAHDAGLDRAVRRALGGDSADERRPTVDGLRGWTSATWAGLVRGGIVPAALRDRLREARTLRAQGFGLSAHGSEQIRWFADLPLRVPKGVFPISATSEPIVAMGLESLEGATRALVVDVATGSGGIALALAEARPGDQVLGVDISGRAVRCARRNAARLRIHNVRFVVGDLLEPVPPAWRGQVALVTANVPFLPPVSRAGSLDKEWPNSTVVGQGVDGLGLVRELLLQAPALLMPGRCLVMQLAPWQWQALSPELSRFGFEMLDRQTSNAAVIGRVRFRGA